MHQTTILDQIVAKNDKKFQDDFYIRRADQTHNKKVRLNYNVEPCSIILNSKYLNEIDPQVLYEYLTDGDDIKSKSKIHPFFLRARLGEDYQNIVKDLINIQYITADKYIAVKKDLLFKKEPDQSSEEQVAEYTQEMLDLFQNFNKHYLDYYKDDKLKQQMQALYTSRPVYTSDTQMKVIVEIIIKQFCKCYQRRTKEKILYLFYDEDTLTQRSQDLLSDKDLKKYTVIYQHKRLYKKYQTQDEDQKKLKADHDICKIIKNIKDLQITKKDLEKYNTLQVDNTNIYEFDSFPLFRIYINQKQDQQLYKYDEKIKNTRQMLGLEASDVQNVYDFIKNYSEAEKQQNYLISNYVVEEQKEFFGYDRASYRTEYSSALYCIYTLMLLAYCKWDCDQFNEFLKFESKERNIAELIQVFTPSIIGFNTSYKYLQQTEDLKLKCHFSYLKIIKQNNNNKKDEDEYEDDYKYDYSQTPFILDDLYDKFIRQVEHMVSHKKDHYDFNFDYDQRLYYKDLLYYLQVYKLQNVTSQRISLRNIDFPLYYNDILKNNTNNNKNNNKDNKFKFTSVPTKLNHKNQVTINISQQPKSKFKFTSQPVIQNTKDQTTKDQTAQQKENEIRDKIKTTRVPRFKFTTEPSKK